MAWVYTPGAGWTWVDDVELDPDDTDLDIGYDKDPHGPPTPSTPGKIEFAVRFSRCDSRKILTCATCWSKDRTWMTVEEGIRFDMHKEHRNCHCWVKYFTWTEFYDWTKLHGTEKA